MAINLIFNAFKKRGKSDVIDTESEVGVLKLDATLRRNYNFTSQVSSHPVEDGGNISDHIKNDPLIYTMTGFVSNSSLKRNLLTIFSSSSRDRVQSAFDALKAIYEAKKPITLQTALSEELTNMVLSNLNIPQDQQSGDSISFTAEFRQIDIAEKELVTVSALNPSTAFKDKAASNQNLGKQPAAAASAAKSQQTLGSFLSNVKGIAKRLF